MLKNMVSGSQAGPCQMQLKHAVWKASHRAQVSVDGDTGQTIISGMGELHLDIYIERMRREYKVLDSPCMS